MSKGILIGNGVNAYLGISDLVPAKIKERFIENVKVYSDIINALFNVRIDNSILAKIQNGNNTSIEVWAAWIYDYIKKQ